MYIKNYCKINKSGVSLNGKQLNEYSDTTLKPLLKHIYRNNEMNYPKFFKMDSLCKLAYICSELILDKESIEENTAIVLSNSASSLDTDRKHQESISDPENMFPSPAVFVYTLPNIAVGEISIRFKLKGENAFFIFDAFDSKFHFNYEKAIFDQQKSKALIGGWVDVDGDTFDAFVYYVSPNEGMIEYTQQNLEKLYKE